jgi:pSer/pThr/pTyr-binding forkhead associated (FHA) protein
MLFCPPLAPIQLGTDQPNVIGRQSVCELAIRHEDVSRQHAEVCFEDGKFMLRDLGSTNGTFVNGNEAQGSVALSPGDRIELGSQVVTFCEVEAGETSDDPEGAQTVLFEELQPREAFHGDLSQIPPFAVMQILELENKSGILQIDGGEGSCSIWFKDGAPIHAESEKSVGFDAALSVVNANEGRFCFDPQAFGQEPTIDCSVTQLLLEACRMEDEGETVGD